MEILRAARPADDQREQLLDAELEAVCDRAFGPGGAVRAAPALDGTYQVTYRVDLRSGEVAYLRFAPPPDRQGVADRWAMRNEHAALPFLAGLGALVPRELHVDFTHELVARDWVALAEVPGVPASGVLASLDPAGQEAFYRHLGVVVRQVHRVRGTVFGRVLGPWHARWSDAVVADVAALARDALRGGVAPDLVERTVRAAEDQRQLFDEVRESALLHGDLWRPNVLVAPGTPRITGVLDHDAASWGDPRSEWALHRARLLPDAQRAAFFAGYGTDDVAQDVATSRRDAVYALRHTLAVRLDIDRRGLDRREIPPVHWDLLPRLEALGG